MKRRIVRHCLNDYTILYADCQPVKRNSPPPPPKFFCRKRQKTALARAAQPAALPPSPNEPAARAARNLCKQKAPSPRGPDPLKLRRAKPRFCGSPFLKDSSASKTTLLLLKLLSRAGFPCAASRAVEPALAREFPHNGKFPVNKWQRAHRALCKKAFVHTQFAPYLALIVLRMTTKLVGDNAI